MRRLPTLLLPLLALPLLLAGCSSSSPDFTVPDDAGPEATIRAPGNATEPSKPYVLRIEVRHESTLGEGVAGAAVVVFEASQGAEAEAMRTGPDGAATARFFIGGTVRIAAGGLDRYTVEEAPQVVLGDPGEEDTLTIVLYDRTRTIEVEGEFPMAAGLPVGGMSAYSDVDVAFSDDEDVDAGYLERLWSASATLRWDNGPDTHGDLYAGLRSADDSVEHHGDDSRQAPGSAGNQETVLIEGDAALDLGARSALGGGLQARAASRSPVVAPDPLAFSFTVVAEFKGSDVTIG